MRVKLSFGCLFVASILLGCGGRTSEEPAGASGSASSGCSTGSERCDCDASGTCNAGLECLGNICVSMANGGASTQGGYSSTDTGGASSAGLDSTYCDGLLANVSCRQTGSRTDMRTINMLLVIDQSGSMKDLASFNATQSKWADLNSTLAVTLRSSFNDINYGLLLFPYSGDVDSPGIDPMSSEPGVVCNVPKGDDPNVGVAVDIGQGLDHVGGLLNALKTSTPAGGTPTARALEQVLKYYSEGNGKELRGSKWVLLVTDGGPNCNPNLVCEAATCTQKIECKCVGDCNLAFNCCESSGSQDYGYICLDSVATISQIDKLAQAGVRTFVVGLPGTESYASTLNAMAEAGKVPNPSPVNGEFYYAISTTNSQQNLADTFTSITSQLTKSCDIPLPESPPDPPRVIVAIDCNLLPRVPTDTPEEGGDSGFWLDYNPSPAHLKVTGSYCTQVKAVGTKSMDVITGCYGDF